MGLSKEKIKSLKKIAMKMKKYGPKEFAKNFNKEYFSVNRKGSTKGTYKTPDGKAFKGNFDNLNKKTIEAKPVKIKGKFSSIKPSEPNQNNTNLNPKPSKERISPPRDYGNRAPNPPVGEEGPGGGGGGGL